MTAREPSGRPRTPREVHERFAFLMARVRSDDAGFELSMWDAMPTVYPRPGSVTVLAKRPFCPSRPTSRHSTSGAAAICAVCSAGYGTPVVPTANGRIANTVTDP